MTEWTEKKPALSQRGVPQFVVFDNPPTIRVGADSGLANHVETKIGQLSNLKVAPERLNWVENVTVGGQPFNDKRGLGSWMVRVFV